MKLRGFLALFVLVLALIYFFWFLRSNKETKIPQEVEALGRVKEEVTRMNMSTLEKAIDFYLAQEGKTPLNLNQLIISSNLRQVRFDAWGNEIRYERVSDFEYRLISAGRDRTFNTEDDLIFGN